MVVMIERLIVCLGRSARGSITDAVELMNQVVSIVQVNGCYTMRDIVILVRML